MGKNFLDMWPGIENTNVYLMIKNCLEKRVDQIMEDEFIFADGSINWFQLKIHSAPEGVTILSNDITSNKKLLLDLTKAKEKAEDINKLKSNFYANISHELRTPFVGIIGYAELLCEALDVPEYKQMAEGILDSSKRMKETIFKILSFSELELKDIQLSMKKADIKKIIENVYNEFADAARRKNLSFSKRINFESFVILTDELLLRDILDNLMSNAVIYTDHGSVDISAETQIEGNDILLIIRISDTGIGIPKDMQEVIWEEFRQASEGHTRKYQGTGLGLSISKKYADLLGAEITLESEEGKGSVFTLHLKDKYTPESNTFPDKKAEITSYSYNEQAITRKKILYVEDDKISADIASIVLSRRYDIDTCSNAAEALERVNAVRFDAIIVDINLGEGMNGEEFVHKIRQMHVYKQIPIIAASAYASNEDIRYFLSKGIDLYITKPFMLKSLLALIDEVFEKIDKDT